MCCGATFRRSSVHVLSSTSTSFQYSFKFAIDFWKYSDLIKAAVTNGGIAAARNRLLV